MKLLRVHVISAKTCGGLLDGLDRWLRSPSSDHGVFDPLCFVGPNGAGKSQFLQVLAEMFQSVFHACVPNEEKSEGNPRLEFELEYLIQPEASAQPVHVLITRRSEGKRRPTLQIQRKEGLDWKGCELTSPETHKLLPSKIVGYTSGDNETLSLPFLVSRSGYAEEVGNRALEDSEENQHVPDTRLMLIDYGTHLEVLAANLLLGEEQQREALLRFARLKDLHSFRCIIQLAHKAVPRVRVRRTSRTPRKAVQLTEELEMYIENLRRCATCHDYDEEDEVYTFDFLLTSETRTAFRAFWESTLGLYAAFHKLAMLNDLAIPRKTRQRFQKDTERRFASRLPEPQDEHKVFRFEQVRFTSRSGGDPVDYVSLSDGEHQLAQILGTMCMVSFPNALFLLDEPESHFNPQWRVKFISLLMDLPTAHGQRKDETAPSRKQECLLTTHSPFVPSDMPREKVFIFDKTAAGKIEMRRPEIQTYGSTFDLILEKCFGINPPMSDTPKKEIKELMQSDNPEEIRDGIERLGHSVEKVFLADHLRQLTEKQGA